MHTVATKVDNTTLDHVKDKCNSLGCTPAEYIRNLIKKDLGLGYDAANNDDNDNIISQSPIPHNSNPEIKLVRSIEQNGKTTILIWKETSTNEARWKTNSCHTGKNCKNSLGPIQQKSSSVERSFLVHPQG